ncbi:hypothetical protein [Streptomyces sp. NPDC057617]|uniref:hypothetical protein n=1 Tax=Streptomyces sp. NPDC057617 TaxID=3346184 RepID=UPI0036AF09EE
MDRYGPRIATLTTATVLLVALGGAATAVDRPKEPSELTLINTGLGQVLADENGNPLYLRLADKPDRPSCSGACAAKWPAAIGFPTKSAGVIGETAQTPLNAVNSTQPHVIYNTHPLYYYKSDRPNEPKGQNVDGFSLVSADGEAMSDRGRSSATAPLPNPAASKAKPKPSATKSKTTAPKPPAPTASATSRGRVPLPRPPGRTSPWTPTPRAPQAPAQKPVAPVAPAQPTRGTATTGTGTGTGNGTGTGTGTSNIPGPSVGALQVTPSGAARGGARHLTSAYEPRRTGTAELTLAIGATAAAAAGTILVVRRRRWRVTGDHH